MSISQTFRSNIVNHVCNGTAIPARDPVTLYVGLCRDTMPTINGGGFNEVPTASTSYARQAVTFAADTAPAANVVRNTNTITFQSNSASGAPNWGNIVGIFVTTAATGGNSSNWLFIAAAGTPRTINAGDQLVIPIGNISLTVGLPNP
jgi:hypothetical protein